MKVFISYSLILLFSFANSTCKKIWKYPISMYGLWTCNHQCNYMLLKIHTDGMGFYGPSVGGIKGCNWYGKTGKVRFTNDAIYIGTMKLKIISKPETLNGNDSLFLKYEFLKHLPATYHGSKIYAKMTLEETPLYGGRTYTFYKTRNY